MSDLPTSYVLGGNYLTPEGAPCIATQNNALQPNLIGGRSAALGWVRRWVLGACPSVSDAFITDSAAVIWDHGRTRHTLSPGKWVAWDGTVFRIVGPTEFSKTYDPVPVGMPAEAAHSDEGQS